MEEAAPLHHGALALVPFRHSLIYTLNTKLLLAPLVRQYNTLCLTRFRSQPLLAALIEFAELILE